jgi:RecA/RadA recombinase
VFGALAAASLPAGAGASDAPAATRPPAGDVDRVVSTGFTQLDALLAAGGLPRAGLVVLRGAGSNGATTIALRTVAEAQAGGALVAWVDLGRSLDPVEAVARGVRLEWLAVLAPSSLDEALAMSGSLLQGRAVDALVLDLALGGGTDARVPPATRPSGSRRPPPSLADRLARLVALARRSGALLLVLEPAEAPAPVRAALAEGSSLRLELRRTGWVRLGREVVGQRTEVRVAKDRHGAPNRRTTLRLLYAEGGPRDRCLARDELLAEEPVAAGIAPAEPPMPISLVSSREPNPPIDAPPPPCLAPPRAPARPRAGSLDPGRRPADPRWAAVG